MNRGQFNVLVNAGILNAKEDKKQKAKSKISLRQIMLRLDQFNKRGIINSLSVQSSGINDCIEYTRVLFKIPKDTKEVKRITKII